MITVVAATHNGAHTLERFLDSMVTQDTVEEWHLLLVDNASTDSSAEIIKGYQDRLPLTYLFESKKGKNAALNHAIPHVQGDVVVFTDDDIIAASDWLAAFRHAVDAYPDYDIFGGTIRPCWEAKPTELHLECIPQGPVYGLTRPDWKEGPCSPFNIWGANMAVRTRIFEAGFRFDERVGPNSSDKQYRMGSETSFTSMLTEKGYKCFHTKGAAVQHIIKALQMEPHWVFERGIRYGRSAFGVPAENFEPARILGYPGYLCVQYMTTIVECFLSALKMNKKRWYQAKWRLNVIRGQLIQAKLTR